MNVIDIGRKKISIAIGLHWADSKIFILRINLKENFYWNFDGE